MNATLPHRGSEEARQVLTTLTALLSSDRSPIECLGFRTGLGIPWPTVVEIDVHTGQVADLLYELCGSREEFQKQSAVLEALRERANNLIAEHSRQLETQQGAIT